MLKKNILFLIPTIFWCHVQSHNQPVSPDSNNSVFLKLNKSKHANPDQKICTTASGVGYIYSPNIKRQDFGNFDVENRINSLKSEMHGARRANPMFFDLPKPKHEFVVPRTQQDVVKQEPIIIKQANFENSSEEPERATKNTEVITINSIKEFEDLVFSFAEIRAVLVKFGAPWSPSSRRIVRPFNELSCEYKGKILFVSVDAPKFLELVNQYGATKLPVFLYFHNGNLVDRLDEANLESLKLFILKIVQEN